MRAARLVEFAVRHTPQPVIRAVGRHTGRFPLLRRLDALARGSLAQPAVIPRGAARGLRFDPGGGRAGFALGTWEPEVQEALREIVEPGSVVWDVGAATGFHALILSRLVGAAGHVVAFEPFPQNIELLRRNLALNDVENVEVVELALSDTPGESHFARMADDEVTVGLMSDAEAGTDSVVVQVTTADALADGGEVQLPRLIKVDIEGAEIAFLAGARGMIERQSPALLIEVHGRWDEFDDEIDRLGYAYTGIEHASPRSSPEPTHVIARRR
jgi:FkbM family methyltransferase